MKSSLLGDHIAPQRPNEIRPVDALLDALREASDLTWKLEDSEVAEALRRKLGEALMEGKTVRSRLAVLEGR